LKVLFEFRGGGRKKERKKEEEEEVGFCGE
jgi:hypothetical protein